MLRRLRTSALVLIGLFAAALLGASPAAASTPIGSNQHFLGLVNGKHSGAVIYTVCPGPVDGDETGPVAGNQTVAVRQVAAGGGDTGAGASAIYARITPTTIVTLRAYNQPQAIPTSARVPCDGHGTVIFSTCPLPQPCGAGARPDSVPVTYIDIAV